MVTRSWNFDGQETVSSEGAVVKWDDETFFTLTFKGKQFHGEILIEDTESNFLKLKIRSQFAVFNILN